MSDKTFTAEEQAYLAKADKLAADYMDAFQVKDPSKPVSARMTCRLVAEVAVMVFQHLNKHTSRLDALEAGGIKYCGIFQRAVTYRKGSVCTADGAMWIALRDTSEGEQPGKAIDAWQLAEKIRVKAGSRKA